jgi:hypothetical protein
MFVVTAPAAKLLGEVADKHRQRLPDVGRRTRRVPTTSTRPLIVEMTETVGPGKAGTARVQKITNDRDTLASGDTITLADADPVRNITVINFRPNWLATGIAYIAHPIAGFWVIENDACFQDFMS